MAGALGIQTQNLVHNSTLIFIIGPPAVGRMAVGHELAQRTGLKLFHNHLSIELVLRFFPFGSPPFDRLVREFRRRIFEEVADSDCLAAAPVTVLGAGAAEHRHA